MDTISTTTTIILPLGTPVVIPIQRKRGSLKDIKERIYLIEDLLLASIPTKDICARFKNDYDLSSAQTQRYITGVYKRWRKNLERRSKYLLENAIEQRNKLIELALSQGDVKTANSVMTERDKILKLYEQKLEIDLTIKNPVLIGIQKAIDEVQKDG